MEIPIAKPSITKKEIDAVVKVMESNHIAQGERVAEFESMLAEYIGVKHVVAISSGTVALFLALKALGIKQGDLVATTPYSFVASTNCILHANAVPFFVDVDRETYNMDVKQLIRTAGGKDLKACLPVDIFGNPFNTNKIKGLPIVLDSCESLGSKMDRPFDVSVYAFYPNKQITTGEGAVICTNNKKVADYCRALRNQGRAEGDTWLESSYCGWNFRMTDIQAAIGISQLQRIDEILEKREGIWLEYTRKFFQTGVIDNIKMQRWERNAKVAPFALIIEVENRDRVILYMKNKGIECRNYFPCIHTQLYMRKIGYKDGDFPIAEEIASKTMAIPFYFDLTDSEICYIVDNLKLAMKEA